MASTDIGWRSVVVYDDSYNQLVEHSEAYQIIQCQGCLTIGFRVVSQRSTEFNYETYFDSGLYPEEIKYYPQRIKGRKLMQDSVHLPDEVHAIYQETLNVLGSDMPIMAGFGIRAIVEAVCNNRGIDGESLEIRINGLKDGGYVSSSAADVLHDLRFMGNKAAHEMHPHTMQELEAAFTVIENLLQNIYIIPYYASQVPERKKKPPSNKGKA